MRNLCLALEMIMSLRAHSFSVSSRALTCEFALERQVWSLVCLGVKIRGLFCVVVLSRCKCVNLLVWVFCREANDAVALRNERVSTACAYVFFFSSE